MSELRWMASKEFYEQHFDQVFSFMKAKTPDRETAMDLTHDVFLRAFQHWSQVQATSSPKAFLFTIAKNVLIDSYRRQASSIVEFSEQVDQAGPDEDSSAPQDSENLKRLLQAIDHLPNQRREIIRLNKIEGLTTEEVAQHLSLSKRTVENQLYRAMKSLRNHLALLILPLLFFY